MSMAILVCFSAFGCCLANVLIPMFYRKTSSFSKTISIPILFELLSLVSILSINHIERLSTTQRKNLRYIRIVTRKVDEATKKHNINLQGSNLSES